MSALMEEEVKILAATHEVIVVLDSLLADGIIPATYETQAIIRHALLSKHISAAKPKTGLRQALTGVSTCMDIPLGITRDHATENR